MGNVWCANASISGAQSQLTYVHFTVTRSILHNAEEFPEPEEFRPERFLKRKPNGEYELDKAVRDPQTMVFGFGRRCVHAD